MALPIGSGLQQPSFSLSYNLSYFFFFFCSHKLWRFLFLALEPLIGRPGVGLAPFVPQEWGILPDLSTKHGCGTSLFISSLLPIYEASLYP